jgi:uncharacterized protein (TIGR02246 family)
MTDAATDDQQIRSLVHRYADAASRRDPAGVASTFTIDGEWHARELGRFQGRDAMVAFFTSMLSGWDVFLQGLLSGVVVVDATNPDRATGRWFVQEIGQRSEGAYLSVAGVYHDEYAREEVGGWLITRRRYDPLLRNADGAVSTLPFPADVPKVE